MVNSFSLRPPKISFPVFFEADSQLLICVHCVLSAFHDKLSFRQNTEELFIGNFKRPPLFAAGVPDDGHALDPAWCLEAEVPEFLGERVLNAELALGAAPEQKVLGVPSRP